MANPNTHLVEALLRVCGEVGALSAHDQLQVLQLAWLLLASNARNEALIVPGGFPAERDRQVGELRRMVDYVTAAEPDLEMERLHLDGDVDGVVRRMQELTGHRPDEG